MWNEHQDAVDQLLVQYRILKSRESDMAELADLIENDWLTKLDRLTDYIIDQDDMTSQFSKGLICAYNIMKGAS